MLYRIAMFGTLLFGIAAGSAFAGSDGNTIQLRCRPFADEGVPPPAPQTDPEAVQRFEFINQEAKAGSHAVLFLGDSLTQKWDQAMWEQNFAPGYALNAGVNGDRTENLLWRIEHGNLAGQRPNVLVLLIGTNDIGRNRSASIIAEGVREILQVRVTANDDARRHADARAVERHRGCAAGQHRDEEYGEG